MITGPYFDTLSFHQKTYELIVQLQFIIVLLWDRIKIRMNAADTKLRKMFNNVFNFILEHLSILTVPNLCLIFYYIKLHIILSLESVKQSVYFLINFYCFKDLFSF